MRLREWLRRREHQRPSSGVGNASPIDDYSTALHAAVALNLLFSTHNTARAEPSHHTKRSPSERPYGPHHTPHDGGGPGSTDPGRSHTHGDTDTGSTGSFDGGASHSSHDGCGGYDGGSSCGFHDGLTSSI
jgi:hypothetical protein